MHSDLPNRQWWLMVTNNDCFTYDVYGGHGHWLCFLIRSLLHLKFISLILSQANQVCATKTKISLRRNYLTIHKQNMYPSGIWTQTDTAKKDECLEVRASNHLTKAVNMAVSHGYWWSPILANGYLSCPWNTRNFNGCEMWIENSVIRVTVWRLMMPKSYPEW